MVGHKKSNNDEDIIDESTMAFNMAMKQVNHIAKLLEECTNFYIAGDYNAWKTRQSAILQQISPHLTAEDEEKLAEISRNTSSIIIKYKGHPSLKNRLFIMLDLRQKTIMKLLDRLGYLVPLKDSDTIAYND